MRNRNPSNDRSRRQQRGEIAALRAGSRGITVRDATTEAHPVTDILFLGATVTDEEDGVALVTIGFGDDFIPGATITATKDTGNPTFNFAALPEGTIQKVTGTYYCPYINQTDATDLRMATASDRDGPWTAYGGTPFFTLAQAQVWAPAAAIVYAPEIVEVGGTFHCFYSTAIAAIATSSQNAIGLCTSSSISGVFTDHGSAVLTPGAAGTPTSRRVGEASVIYQSGLWVMAFMGEDSDLPTGESEKVFIATAPAPEGPWTVANSGNPAIDWGTGGSGYDALAADPYLFYADGYYWIMFAGSDTSTPTVSASQYLAYATTPTGTWTVLPDPILEPGTAGAWDDAHVFRGSIYQEAGTFSGVYCGFDGTATYKGGNFRLDLDSASVAATPRASDIDIDDVGGYYDGTEVESALQEIGADLLTITTGGAGHYEVIVSGSAPPVAVTNIAEDDWIYGFVPG